MSPREKNRGRKGAEAPGPDTTAPGSSLRLRIAGGVIALVAFVAAGTWLALGGGGGADGTVRTGESPQAAEFVGTTACASCHQAQHTAWRGSQHDLAMQEAREGTVLADFDATFTHEGVTSTFFRRDGKFMVRTDGPDGALHDFEVRYTYGVYPIQQYLIQLSDGRIQPLSISWDARERTEGGQRWFHLYPGGRVEHTDELHWTSRQQNWNFTCADCHSTNVRKGYDAAADRMATTWSEIDVGCEACHGPGSEHRRWARTPSIVRGLLWPDKGLTAQLTERSGIRWTVDATSGKPVRSEPRETSTEVGVCSQCHSRRAQLGEGYVAGAPPHDYYQQSLLMPGLYHADGQQRDEVYTHASFLQSRMFHAGVTCSDCHDPHSQTLRAAGNQVCGQCHTASRYDVPAHHFHPAGSAGAQCVSCHMPETTYMLIDPRRDHSIRVPRPDQTVALGMPNACNACHVDESPEWAAGRVREWLGRDAVGFQTFAEAFHADDTDAPGAEAALLRLGTDPGQPAIVRASALARLADESVRDALGAAQASVGDPDPMVRRAALLLLDAVPPQQRTGLAAPLLSDPVRAVRMQAAWALAPASGSLVFDEQREGFERAAEEFIASQRYNADRPESRTTLGTFFAQLGRTAEAAAEYRAAIRLAPGFIGAYVNLADLYRGQAMEADAESVLRQGIAIAPEDPALRYSLGLSLARSGRVPEAVVELRLAAELGADDPSFAYAYAVALHSSGRRAEAIRVLEAARARYPRDRDILSALALFHRDEGNLEEARRYARSLAEIDQDDPEAQALLRSLGAPAPP